MHAYFLKGYSVFEKKDYNSAIDYFKQVPKTDKDYALVQLYKAAAYYYLGSEYYTFACVIYSEIIARSHYIATHVMQVSAAFCNLGAVYSRMNRVQAAVVHYTEAVRKYPNNTIALLRGCELATTLNDAALAFDFFSKFHHLDDAYLKEILQLPMLDSENVANADKSDLIEKILRLDPDNECAWIINGELYFKKKDYRGALACLDFALKLHPENSFTLEYRKEIFEHQNMMDYQNMLEEAKQILEEEPESDSFSPR